MNNEIVLRWVYHIKTFKNNIFEKEILEVERGSKAYTTLGEREIRKKRERQKLGACR